ncbi:MAG: sugar O-acetyltransferase [Bacteroidales bacterium]|nr:sugar O-acetyltransferase [Bacteroidales bacterium]
MKTEKQKMLSGLLYNAADAELTNERLRTRLLLKEFNSTGENYEARRKQVLKKLIPNAGSEFVVQSPFYCDYGTNIYAGNKVFFNFNCVVLDVMPVSIGSNTLIGPNVQIYTATHPMDYKERALGLEFAKPVTIGTDVWIGGSTVICPGVTIGDRCVIGAGSVVIKDIPAGFFAAGNPCRVIREIT